MLIINADDWGRSVAETDAALKCFRERRITSVRAMVFMQDSKRAAKLTKDYELDDVGLHLNFSEEFTDKSCSKTLKETQGRIIRFLKRSKYAQQIAITHRRASSHAPLCQSPPGQIDSRWHEAAPQLLILAR